MFFNIAEYNLLEKLAESNEIKGLDRQTLWSVFVCVLE